MDMPYPGQSFLPIDEFWALNENSKLIPFCSDAQQVKDVCMYNVELYSGSILCWL